MDRRELQALEIAARSRIVFDGKAWSVPSQSGNGKYAVALQPPSCTCEDFQRRQQACKHALAVRYVVEREGGAQPKAPPADAVLKKASGKQCWPVYDLCQTTAKHRLKELLFDLRCGIEEPPPAKRGSHRHLYRDAIFAMAFKVYSTVSARRFHCDLRDAPAQGYLTRPAHGVKVCAFTEDPAYTPVLYQLIVRTSLPRKAVETTFAPDSSGFSTSRFVRWFDEKYGVHKSGYDWLKAHLMCGVRGTIITAVEIHGRDAADCPLFKPLLKTTAENFKIGEVPADKAYLSHDNLELVESHGGVPSIPFKSNSVPGEPGGAWERLYHFYNLHREEFLKRYHQRSNIASTLCFVSFCATTSAAS